MINLPYGANMALVKEEIIDFNIGIII